MLQHKTLALRGGRAGRPEIRKTLFFVETGAALRRPPEPRARC